MKYPTLDAHGHLLPPNSPRDLRRSGAVLAMTCSLEEAEHGLVCSEPGIVWGVGCHPRDLQAQTAFSVPRFRQLLAHTPVAGEVGLDAGSRIPMEVQLATFRQILDVVGETPRIVSIHSYRATRLVLDELHRRPVAAPLLHWWTGSAGETTEAVELGCYFSIHPAIARQSKFRSRVPLERILVESDHGYHDPPAAIPCRIEWAEHLTAQQYQIPVQSLRERVWRNLGAIIRQTGTEQLWPEQFLALSSGMKPETAGA